jgi:hypothetical protein
MVYVPAGRNMKVFDILRGDGGGAIGAAWWFYLAFFLLFFLYFELN